MAEHNDLGKKGEALAVKYLAEKGYQILDTNWKYIKEEIDIVATEKDFIVFVEVKTRSSEIFSSPEESINNKKQKYLVNAADAYIKKYNIETEARFDVITIILKGNESQLEHIPFAFYPVI